MTDSRCRRCGAALDLRGTCAGCLLDTGIGMEAQSAAERLFRIALSYDEKERTEFLEQAAGGDAPLMEEVRMLLEGYAEAGGDDAAPTLGGADSARSQWAAARNEEAGTVIGHFRLIRLIGEGGMGSVWEAEQMEPMRRRVALKVIKQGMDTREVVRRFERERQALALMAHPHIARVYEAGATGPGRPYFAMELVEGVAVTEYCRRENCGVRARLALFLEVCGAVEHAHQKGVIHRDLKPSNILVAGGKTKVIDFGVAKATQDDGGDGLFTRQAQVLGTPAYMSPEQAESDGVDVDTRTDVYSLGVVLYELLSGTLPFDPRRLAATGVREMQRILREEMPARPSTRLAPARQEDAGTVQQPDLRGDLDWIVMKALSKERARRYPGAAAFAEDIRRYLNGEAVSAVPPTLAYRFGKFVRRNRAAVAATVAVMLVLAAGLIVSLLQTGRTREALAGEARARNDATLTVADLYTRSGLAAADAGDGTRAALWFANAAVIAAADADRAAVNHLRAGAWRQEAMTAVRAVEPPFDYVKSISWNPRHPVLILTAENEDRAECWNAETEAWWHPLPEPLRGALWDSSGDYLAVWTGNAPAAVVGYPSGRTEASASVPGSTVLAWSPDGRWIVLTGEPVCLWEWRTGKIIPLPGPAARAAFSRDGRRLLLQSGTTTGVCSMDNPGAFLHAPVATPDYLRSWPAGDGDIHVTCQEGGIVEIRDSLTGAVRSTHPPSRPEQALTGAPLTVSPDGRYLTRVGLPLLDLREGREAAFPAAPGHFLAASFSGDSTLCAIGGYDNVLRLWDVKEGRLLGVAGHHHSAVVSAVLSPDGRWLASAEQGLARIWRTAVVTPCAWIPVGWPTTGVFSPDSRLVLPSGLTNRGVSMRSTRALDSRSGAPAGPVIDPGGAIMDAVMSHDGAWAALAVSTVPDRAAAPYETDSGSGNIQIWDYRTGERLGDPVPMPSEPRSVCLHPGGGILGVCCGGGEGVEIDLATRAVRVLFRYGSVSSPGAIMNNGRCSFTPDGTVFAMWGLFRYTTLWDRGAGRDLIEPFRAETTSFDLDFAAGGGVAANVLFSARSLLEFRDWRTGLEAAPPIPCTHQPLFCRFSPDGNLLLSGGGSRTAQLWDWRTGTLACPVLPHTDSVMAGTFVPGTPWVITGGADSRIRFWDRRSGMPVRPPLPSPGWVTDLKIPPGNPTLLAGGFLGGSLGLIDLNAALPVPELDAAGIRLLAEIDADAEIHPGGGLAPFTAGAWMEKWRQFRTGYPAFSGHRMKSEAVTSAGPAR